MSTPLEDWRVWVDMIIGGVFAGGVVFALAVWYPDMSLVVLPVLAGMLCFVWNLVVLATWHENRGD